MTPARNSPRSILKSRRDRALGSGTSFRFFPSASPTTFEPPRGTIMIGVGTSFDSSSTPALSCACLNWADIAMSPSPGRVRRPERGHLSGGLGSHLRKHVPRGEKQKKPKYFEKLGVQRCVSDQ